MRILLVDDQEFLCDAFARYLEIEQARFSGTPITVIPTYTLPNGIAYLSGDPPIDFVFLDLGLGGDCVGASTLQRFQSSNPRNVPVVVFTGMDLALHGTIETLRECLFTWNALGILPKGAPVTQIFVGLSRLLANERWMPDNIFQAMATHLPQNSFKQNLGLAPREWQVAQCLAKGLSNKEIANEMKLSPGYVAQVTAQIYSKLQVTGRAKAVIKMRDSGALR
jgi:two-component system nitrate/nitrite response regulator NarL